VFSVGDKVIYGSKIVCSFNGIEDKDFDNETRSYYVLKPIFENASTIFLPVDGCDIAGKLRRLLTIEEIYLSIKEISYENTMWADNANEREEQYKQLLAKDDHVIILKLIVTLYLRKERGEKLNKSDELTFKNAMQVLCDELAYILNLKNAQVFPFIFEEIKTGARNLQKGIGRNV
jgi:CarD family transcriptional regulator